MVLTRYPESFFTALAKVGGLIVLLRVSILLTLYHKNQFFKAAQAHGRKEEFNPHKLINETKESLLIEEHGDLANSSVQLSQDRRFAFERIEEGLDRIDDCHR